MSWYNPLSWFRKLDPALADTEIIEPIAPELAGATTSTPRPVDAAISVLILIHEELGDKPLPSDLREISDHIHYKVPLSIRDGDSPSERAEFALTIQRGALFLKAMKDWYDAP